MLSRKNARDDYFSDRDGLAQSSLRVTMNARSQEFVAEVHRDIIHMKNVNKANVTCMKANSEASWHIEWNIH